MKQWIIGGLIILVLIASYMWNRKDEEVVEEKIPAEEILVQEDGTTVKKVGDNIEVMSEEEVIAKKQEISDKISNVEPITINAIEGKSGSAQSQRVFSDGQYFQRVILTDLPQAQKGYYYEVWLEKEDDTRTSIGRAEMTSVQGELYYSTKEDKSDYKKIIVSYEAEDGNPEIGEIVLEGSYE